MPTTTSGAALPVLYATPLPEAAAERAVEELRRVRRSTYGGRRTKGERQVFPSEQAAWDWITAEHAARAEAQMPKLVTMKLAQANALADTARFKYDDARVQAEMWLSLSRQVGT